MPPMEVGGVYNIYLTDNKVFNDVKVISIESGWVKVSYYNSDHPIYWININEITHYTTS